MSIFHGTTPPPRKKKGGVGVRDVAGVGVKERKWSGGERDVVEGWGSNGREVVWMEVLLGGLVGGR